MNQVGRRREHRGGLQRTVKLQSGIVVAHLSLFEILLQCVGKLLAILDKLSLPLLQCMLALQTTKVVNFVNNM